MTLWDVDKAGDNRGSPQPNTGDEIPGDSRMAHNTHSTVFTPSQAKPSTRIVYKNNMTLTYDANGLVSSVYGYVASVSSVPVFIIAKQGYDVFVDVLGIPAPTSI